jgi:senataxin
MEAGIFLLQGPPGTGKTTTLMGLIATHYHLLKGSNTKYHESNKILICAPSNAAINYITKKLKTEGVVGAGGGRDHPKMLRVGVP